MNVVPLRWHGKARGEALRALVQTQAQDWLQGWAACTIDQCNVTHMDDEKVPSSGAGYRWYRMDVAAGVLTARIPLAAFEQIGCRLSGVEGADSNGLASGIGKRAFQDALRTFCGGAGDATELDAAPVAAQVGVRYGAIGLEWSLAGIRMELYLDRNLCDALVPTTRSAGPLASRREAVLEERVTLSAVLDFGPVELADAAALKPGEVIKTSTALGTLVRVTTASGETVFSGELVAESGKRALRCVGATQLQG